MVVSSRSSLTYSDFERLSIPSVMSGMDNSACMLPAGTTTTVHVTFSSPVVMGMTLLGFGKPSRPTMRTCRQGAESRSICRPTTPIEGVVRHTASPAPTGGVIAKGPSLN